MHPNPTNNRVHEMLLFELASPISSQQWDTCSSLKKKKKKQFVCGSLCQHFLILLIQ